MREIRTSGSEGGEGQLNGPSLPLSMNDAESQPAGIREQFEQGDRAHAEEERPDHAQEAADDPMRTQTAWQK